MEETAGKQERSKTSGGLKKFFAGVKAEFKKISWPDRQSTVKQTVAVAAISIVVGIIIAVLDIIVQYGVDFLTTL